jgi:hypothetical protein
VIGVIGGNQRDDEFNHQAITRKLLGRRFHRRVSGSRVAVELHSFRTKEFLR